VDGILKEVDSPPVRSTAAIISRVKIMAKLNIAERRLPQDGRIPLRVQGKELDLRVSTVPTMFGESVVMRLLDKESVRFDLDSLGFDGSPRERLLSVLDLPYGIILVTGPTGSGKSTTLYTALARLNTQERKIITVEDPVEYQLHGINQVQTHADIGLTFAAGLRSILRQDPDIVLIGEIRDGETASIAVQAALTGHLVLSTLHTNDAAGAIARMVYMGIEPFLLASSLLMTQAQRLYRKLCPACKQARKVPDDLLRTNHIDPEKFQTATLFQSRGCPKCNNTGYKGRGALMEILMVDDVIREMILKNANANNIRAEAVKKGMLTLREVGLLRVSEGTSTFEEMLRCTGGE
jgi:general secretion pathway protein E